MKIAFVFPGQGSQLAGMLDAWEDNVAVANVVARASESLNQDLKSLIALNLDGQLDLTVNTQPAMLTADMAIFSAWRAAGGPMPDMMAGHSLGEYAALTAAQSLTIEQAVQIVRIRAQAMQAVMPIGSGGMAVILGLDVSTIKTICQAAAQNETVEAVNFNAPLQTVIAGHTDAIKRACQSARIAGAKRAILLPVSGPFHSSLLKPAAAQLELALETVDLLSPQVPIINNVDVAIPCNSKEIKDALVRQTFHPVRWVETLQFMSQQAVTHVIECGPGKVLAGLTRRISDHFISLNIHDPFSLNAALAEVKKS